MSTGQAMTDMYGALLNGGAIYPWDIKEEGLSHVATWLMEGEITIYRSTSTIFRAFIDTLTGKEKFPTIRLVRLGSEPVSKSDVEAYNQHFAPHCLFVNTLSSTEARTIRQYFVDKATLITGSLVPVGYAFEDIEILLLDENGEEVGYDRVGEIAIKSRYLTPGYWRRPDLTYTAFTSDSAERKARIYRSGDLGHMLPDGCLVHLGRKDMQVKIRGYRVELAEIEMALLEHTAVKEIAVVARENRPGDQHLVAYVVPTNRSTDTVSVLRRFLNDKLPAYMVPSVFVLLNALPRTANGKVDRLALPKSTTARPEQESPFVAPRTPAEESLAEIWTQVLGLDQVGIHDNFFDLGGHSLLATQVISRVINAFKVELPIKSLFESPTVADMTVVITENMAKKAGGEELARMLAELESISDEEARKRLADEEAKEDSEK